MDNEELYDKALQAINDLFSDKSVSQSKCKSNLREIISEIEVMISSLKDDEE